ncbi:MAG: hydrolase [Clostridiaceae bacterium]|nr:hydrolase [Clostridiaceae bacterium]
MSDRNRKFVPEVKSGLRDDSIIVTPSVIRNSSGIKIYNRRIKSFIFTTDIATITYSDADAIMAVYPQTPHPAIVEAITAVASQPVFAGVGGGTTGGKRSAYVAEFAEARGAMGIVVNSPTTISTIRLLENSVECPIVATIVSHYDDVESKLNAGVDILNVANGKDTAKLVEWLRKRYPEVPIIATGGPTDETIQQVIDAGANAISWTPPTNAELFKSKMVKYRIEKRQTFMDNHGGMTMNEYEDRNFEH